VVIGHCCDLFVYKWKHESGDHCMTEKLLQTLFSSHSYDHKLKIIEEGAPKSNINLHTKIKTCTRHFNTSLYEAIPWLCGYDKLNKLFCWPCLFFSKEKHMKNRRMELNYKQQGKR
jgi:hypothetical protein